LQNQNKTTQNDRKKFKLFFFLFSAFLTQEFKGRVTGLDTFFDPDKLFNKKVYLSIFPGRVFLSSFSIHVIAEISLLSVFRLFDFAVGLSFSQKLGEISKKKMLLIKQV
jgi:hypothetical protein